ncbi:MAG: penicillin-binding protein activator [Gammaproteobacteria bacterium]|nr:penicillin-binding protein activator [Gammaproteobacteria bacterium]
MMATRSLPVLSLLALGLLSAGCAHNARPPASLERAAALSARGDHAAAAREYEALSIATRGSATNATLLPAAKEWLRANDAAAAEAALARLVTPLEVGQSDTRLLLLAEAALVRGEAARGWELIGTMGAPVGALRIDDFHALRQRLALATNRPIQAIRSQIDRETAAVDAAATQRMRQDFLREIITAVDRGITLDPRVAGRDAIARGWLEVAPLAARASRAPRESNAGITAAWRKRYPAHPAVTALASLGQAPLVVPTSASAESTSSAGASPAVPNAPTATSGLLPLGTPMPRVAHVAVLLPLSGRNSALGAQIREGLLAAYFAEPQAMRTPVRFYDTARQSVAEAFAAAMQGGAVTIIGPLARDEVVAAAISAAAPGATSVIVLNALPTGQSAPANLRQFALSPEDEARAVARRALAEGHRRAIALIPAGDWGARVLQAFREELEAGGGALLGTETITGRDLGNAAQSLLRLEASIARHRRIQSVLDMPLAFQPRRRADVDLIFMPGTAATLRRWRPQLRFQGAGDLPAYATSEAFDGRAGDELQGLIFPDIDWMIAPQSPFLSALRTATDNALSDSTPRSRLFALGHDAWLLHAALRAGRSPSPAAPLAGAIGTFFIDEDGRVQRSLRFALIDDGEVKLLDPPDGGG